jgi:hypothetical protein
VPPQQARQCRHAARSSGTYSQNATSQRGSPQRCRRLDQDIVRRALGVELFEERDEVNDLLNFEGVDVVDSVQRADFVVDRGG